MIVLIMIFEKKIIFKHVFGEIFQVVISVEAIKYFQLKKIGRRHLKPEGNSQEDH